MVRLGKTLERERIEDQPGGRPAPPAAPAAIAMVDTRRDYAELKEEIERAVCQTLASGEYCLGSQAQAFESEAARYLEVPFAIGVSSGTDALLLALTELGVGPGDEVIAPAFTFIATATGIARLGARPVFVDVEPGGFQMDPAGVAKAITRRTRAIIPVHLYGAPAPIGSYLAAASAAGREVAVVEDACQAIGSRTPAGPCGTAGVWGCYSFYPTKNLPACGDAGLMVTRSPERAERVRRLRAHGVEENRAYHHTVVGINARLDGIQAAILRVRLRHLDRLNEVRAAHARTNDQALAGSGLLDREDPRSGAPALRRFPAPAAGELSNHHQYPLRASRRDELRAHLAAKGIQSAVFYPTPLPFQPAFRSLGHRTGDFPHAEELAREVLCLPVHPQLAPGDPIRVVEEIARFYS
jgi:dTDP-4-amino-4,6-dideoxygalactose transaminase